jgi:hypothetical protein
LLREEVDRLRKDAEAHAATVADLESLRNECDFHQRTSVKLGDVNVERAQEIEQLRAELAAAQVARASRMPSFVVLSDHYAWMENGCLMSFEANKVIRDRHVIRVLIEKKANLLEGGL